MTWAWPCSTARAACSSADIRAERARSVDNLPPEELELRFSSRTREFEAAAGRKFTPDEFSVLRAAKVQAVNLMESVGVLMNTPLGTVRYRGDPAGYVVERIMNKTAAVVNKAAAQ